MMRTVLLSQWRLARRSAGPWITLAAGVALALAVSRGGATGRIIYHFSEHAAPLVWLMAMLFTAAAARRERTERVHELLGALPYEVTPWILGRFLTHYLTWLAVSVAAWAAAGAAVVMSGHPLDLSALALNWATMVPVTLAWATAMALLIGSLARTAVTAYFLTLLAWVGGPLSTLLLSRSTIWLPPPILEFFAGYRVAVQGATGFFYNADLLFFNRLFTLGVAAIALSCLLVVAARQRRRPVFRHGVALALAVLLAVWSAREIALDWNVRYAAVRDELAQLYEADRQLRARSGGRFERMPEFPVVTDDYHLTISLDPWPHRMRVVGRFTVTNVSGGPLASIPLTLRQNFTVGDLTVDGTPVTAQRDGDHLLLPVSLAPGETRQVNATWEGTVWQWRMRDGPRAAAHIHEESVVLPAHYGWYPLPGVQQFTRLVGECAEFLPDHCPMKAEDLPVSHPPASFHIQVTGTDLHIRHNGDTATATGLNLVGTPWNEQEIHGLLVSVSPDNRVQAERAAAEIAGLIAEYEAMVPRGALGAGPVRLIQVHDTLYYGAPWLPTAGTGATPGTLLIHGQELARYSPGFFSDVYDRTVLSLWWPINGFTVDQSRLYEGFRGYMGYVRSGEPPGFQTETFRRLMQLEQTAGREAALQVLREMYALLPAGPTPEAFDAAVSRVAGVAGR